MFFYELHLLIVLLKKKIEDTATGVLLNQVDCASEVTGIQFNAQLKQVATSHHSVVSDSSGTPIEIGTVELIFME